MDFKKRMKLAREGKFVLRVMKNASDSYHIAYQTVNGGWAMYHKQWAKESKTFCETMVDQLVRSDPDKFYKEDII